MLKVKLTIFLFLFLVFSLHSHGRQPSSGPLGWAIKCYLGHKIKIISALYITIYSVNILDDGHLTFYFRSKDD